MNRPPDPRRRARILEQCFDAAQRGGRLDLSLAEFFAQTGISARMLIYHFGSSEGLQLALGSRLEAELRTQFAAMEGIVSGGGAGAVLAVWDHMSMPQMRDLMRILADVLHRAVSGDAEAALVADTEVQAWSEFLSSRFSDEAVTAILVVFVGAAIDLLMTGDSRRGRRSIELVLAGIEAVAHGVADPG